MTASNALRWPLFLSLFVFCSVSLALAEKGGKEDDKDEENIRKGTIASTGSYGFGDTSIDSGSTAAAPGDQASVINGSVSKLGRDNCQVSLVNSSELNSYSVSYRVVGRDDRGTKVFKKSYSARISSGEKYTKSIRCRHELSYEIVLSGARKR